MSEIQTKPCLAWFIANDSVPHTTAHRYSDLLDNIEKSVLTEAKHHALLIGPRGIGKTHLIAMIYHRVAANQIFKDKLKIAWLREEEWGIACEWISP